MPELQEAIQLACEEIVAAGEHIVYVEPNHAAIYLMIDGGLVPVPLLVLFPDVREDMTSLVLGAFMIGMKFQELGGKVQKVAHSCQHGHNGNLN